MGQYCCPAVQTQSSSQQEVPPNVNNQGENLLLIQLSKSLRSRDSQLRQDIEKTPVENINAGKEVSIFKYLMNSAIFARYPNDSPIKPPSKNTTKDGSYKNLIIIWIDKRVYSNQNSRNLRTFKYHGLQVIDVSSIATLKTQLLDTTLNDIVLVISAASLEIEDYRFMQSQEKIKDILLFCMNQQGARMLMDERNNLSKISGAAYNARGVLQEVQRIQQRYVDEGLIDPETVVRLNFGSSGVVSQGN